jgi:hypothetical protein
MVNPATIAPGDYVRAVGTLARGEYGKVVAVVPTSGGCLVRLDGYTWDGGFGFEELELAPLSLWERLRDDVTPF